MTDSTGQITVTDNPDQNRYELTRDGQLIAHAVYDRTGGQTVFVHTEVDPAAEGQGLGSRLAHDALDDVRRRGDSVRPDCPFIAHYIQRHQEYADLLGSGPG